MAISFVGGASAHALNGANPSATLPGTIAQDDLVIAVVSHNDTALDSTMAMSTAGYTKVADLYANDANDANVGVFYKYMGATPDTTAVAQGVGNTSNETNIAVLVFRGVKTVANGGPFAATATTATGINGANPDPPSISFTDSGVWTVIAAGNAFPSGTTTFTLPTGYTTNAQQDSAAETAGSGGAVIGYSSSPTSPENPAAITSSAGDTTCSWAAVTMALLPSAVQLTGVALSAAPSLPAGTALKSSNLGGVALSISPSLPFGGLADPNAIAPTHLIEIAFGTDPTVTPVWDDVTDYVRAFTVGRGTNHELDQPAAGKATITLDNRDRRFDPTYDAGPYYPNVLPMRRVRIRAAWMGVIYPVFQGYIESWPQQYPGRGADALVEVEASDGFLPLAAAKVSATYSQEASGARITNILDDAGWPAADRDVDAGNSTIAAATLDSVPALTHLLDVSTAEMGLLFMGRDGNVRFVERHSFFLSSVDATNYTWGDIEGEHRYIDIIPQEDHSQIYNDVRITPDGGTEQVATDATSQGRFFLRTLSRSVVLASDSAALDQANYLLSRYKDAYVRVPSMELAVIRETAQWSRVLDREIGDRLVVRRRHPAGGDPLERQVYIVGVEIQATPSDAEWSVTWRLAPFDAQTPWILGDPESGQLGMTTRLGF
jgi:hypothetical protein